MELAKAINNVFPRSAVRRGAGALALTAVLTACSPFNKAAENDQPPASTSQPTAPASHETPQRLMPSPIPSPRTLPPSFSGPAMFCPERNHFADPGDTAPEAVPTIPEPSPNPGDFGDSGDRHGKTIDPGYTVPDPYPNCN